MKFLHWRFSYAFFGASLLPPAACFPIFFIRLYASYSKIALDKMRVEKLSVAAGLGFGTLISAAGLFMWIEILFSLLAGSALIIALAAVCAKKAERDLAPGAKGGFACF